MKCRFVKAIYHNKDNGYCVYVYHTEDPGVPDAAKSKWYKGKGAQFTAVAALFSRRMVTLVVCHRINRYNDMRTKKGKVPEHLSLAESRVLEPSLKHGYCIKI